MRINKLFDYLPFSLLLLISPVSGVQAQHQGYGDPTPAIFSSSSNELKIPAVVIGSAVKAMGFRMLDRDPLVFELTSETELSADILPGMTSCYRERHQSTHDSDGGRNQ